MSSKTNAQELNLKMLRVYSQRVLNLKEGERAVVANGRVLGPLEENESFSSEDFNLLERFSSTVYLDKINNILTKDGDEEDGTLSFSYLKICTFCLINYCFLYVFILDISSNVLLKIVSLLVSRPQTKSRFDINFGGDEHSVVKIPAPHPDQVAFDIVAIVDPVSRGAQKLGPILQVLQEVLNCNIRVFLNCVEKNSDMPVKR